MNIRPTVKELFEGMVAASFAKSGPVPQVQRQEMERAFFAGYGLALGHLVKVTEAYPEGTAERYLKQRIDECNDYFTLLGKIPGEVGGS
jgi:hypothetical protein